MLLLLVSVIRHTGLGQAVIPLLSDLNSTVRTGEALIRASTPFSKPSPLPSFQTLPVIVSAIGGTSTIDNF